MKNLSINYKKNIFCIFGAGITGISVMEWLHSKGAKFFILDDKLNEEQIAEKTSFIFDKSATYICRKDLQNISFDFLVISPGVDDRNPTVKLMKSRKNIHMISDFDLFFDWIKSYPKTFIVGITGTNGKSTVSLMVNSIFKASKINSEVAGNIGIPILSLILNYTQKSKRLPSAFVLELSSFQLDYCKSLSLDVGAILNVSPDHMDRYRTFELYSKSKRKIYKNCKLQIVNRDCSNSSSLSYKGKNSLTYGLKNSLKRNVSIKNINGKDWIFFNSTCLFKKNYLNILGNHNIINALAAISISITNELVKPENIKLAFASFKSLFCRMQFVTKIKGVTFINDSKGTNVAATIFALEEIFDPTVLILGGDAKGQNFENLKKVISIKSKAVILIGKDSNRILNIIKDLKIIIKKANNMFDAVKEAFAVTIPGDVILLSPACSSLDMYKNYEKRGLAFIEAVKKLEKKYG